MNLKFAENEVYIQEEDSCPGKIFVNESYLPNKVLVGSLDCGGYDYIFEEKDFLEMADFIRESKELREPSSDNPQFLTELSVTFSESISFLATPEEVRTLRNMNDDAKEKAFAAQLAQIAKFEGRGIVANEIGSRTVIGASENNFIFDKFRAKGLLNSEKKK